MSDEMKRLKDAIEGECNGMAISDEQARNIIAYITKPTAQDPIGCTDDDGGAWAFNSEGGKFPPRIKLYAAPVAPKD
jgi:hypothetical protein